MGGLDGGGPRNTLPTGWPVLVTGAAGFVGGHVARELARGGYRVRALTRREPVVEPGDPPIEWFRGDLGSEGDVAGAVAGVRGVIHCGGWVSLGPDRGGLGRKVNVEGTRSLLDAGERAGVERFVYTSTLWTTAAGTAEQPADESSPWNLHSIQGPYCRSKTEAERMVLDRDRSGFQTNVVNPGMVLGTGDRRPTSTGIILLMSRLPVAVLAGGGIPLVDARVLALGHRRVLEGGEPGRRYIIAGRYVSYPEMARLVASLVGRPRFRLVVPDRCAALIRAPFGAAEGMLHGILGELSGAGVAGGFLRLHITGAAADARFGLVHPDPIVSIFETLDDHRRAGRAPWLKSLRAPDEINGEYMSPETARADESRSAPECGGRP